MEEIDTAFYSQLANSIQALYVPSFDFPNHAHANMRPFSVYPPLLKLITIIIFSIPAAPKINYNYN